MSFTLLRASIIEEYNTWTEAWNHLPADRRDVYFLPGYLLANEKVGRGEACCILVEVGEAMLLYPFLKCRINITGDIEQENQFYDIQSAYGYGGPVVNEEGSNKNFLAHVWQLFSDWCTSSNVIAEFCRFHPLVQNSLWAPKEMRIIEDRKTVAMDLNTYPEAIWNESYFRVQRNMVRRAEREGYSFEKKSALEEMSWFFPMYIGLQERLKAEKKTLFGREYFETLAEKLGEKLWLGVVTQEYEVIAAVLVLEGAQFAHSHLMGYGAKKANSGMTNYLYHEVALNASQRGLSVLHMGGGKTSDEKDPLFRFKESLGQERHVFNIGMRCHDSKMYEVLGKRWEEKNGLRPTGYFLFYHL